MKAWRDPVALMYPGCVVNEVLSPAFSASFARLAPPGRKRMKST